MGAISDAAPALWLKADAITGLVDGDPLGSWTDSSGNGNTATQATSGAKPTYKTGVQNGLPAVLFDGGDSLASAASGSGSKSVAVAFRATGATYRTLVSGSFGGAVHVRVATNYKIDLLSQTSSVIGSSANIPATSGEWHVAVITYTSGSAWAIHIDGTLAASGSTSTTLIAGATLRIGTGGTSSSEFFTGHMGEVATWDRVLTGTEITDVAAELKAKWATVDAPLTGVTFTADSTFSADWVPANLGDGGVGFTTVPTYSWSPAGSSPVHWVRAQPASATVVDRYRIVARTDAPAYTPSAWTWEGSNDGTSWTTLDTRTAQSFAAGEAKTYTATNSTAWTYYRLNITATANGQQSTFSELSLYATTATGSTGTVSGVAPSPTATVTGSVTIPGDVSASAPAPTVSVTGNAVAAGTVSATAPSPTAAIDGTVSGVTSGVVAASAPAPTVAIDGTAPETITGTVSASAPAPNVTVTDSVDVTEVPVGVTIEVGALTLLNLVALPGVDIPIGLGVESGDAQPVVPLPGVSVEIGLSVIGRQADVPAPDPRRQRPQWRYVITDLANTPIGELTDIEHDPVEDGVGEPGTMQFSIATDNEQHALIKPIERQCQVWDGDVLRLRGPILPGQPSDDGTTMTYKIHDPSWFWRDGRRVITRTPQKNLLRNGDFKAGLTYWTRGYDADSKPKAAPNVRVVSEDFADDTNGLDPIKAAEITGVESVTESELSSNAVFWPNLATFRPGGVEAIEAVANDMPTTAGLKVLVVGHTANDGTGNGLDLSLRRAQAAAAIIHTKRPAAVITTKGVGFYDPKPGYPVDSQEQRRVVISYDQTITGESKQWMRQTIEVTQPKAARYSLTLTAAAMLKVADDWSVPDANMVSVKIVARRKSAPSKPWDETLGVGSSSISDTDPVDRWIPQTAEATIPADDRPYLVDVYLYAPAALARYTAVGLFPEEQLYFWGVDQALIFKGVMEHIQKPEFGYADLGVYTRTPLTGILRDREWSFRDLTPADTALDGLMGISRGLEWDTVTTHTRTTATTFYPRQGKTAGYVLVQGGNVTKAVPATTRDVGSAVIAQAQGLGSYRAVAYANDARAFGGTLIQRVVTAEQDTPLNELRETAKAELFWARSSTPSYWVDIDPDSISDVLANTAKGDTVRLILDNPTPVDQLARIVRRQIHPDGLRMMLAFEEV